LIGKALNNKIIEGEIVHVGVVARRDGLNACERVSVVCTDNPRNVTKDQKYWFDFVEQAYRIAVDSFADVAKKNLPARVVEQTIINFFKSKSEEVSRKVGKKIDLSRQKPYTTFHNSGYTEYAEFFGAITLNSNEPLGHQIVNMADMAVRGVGSYWDDVVIPGLNYLVVEKTLGKYGEKTKVLNDLPINVQHFVGGNF
jgi:hypothetical protein